MLLGTKYKMKPPVSARIVHGHPLADKLIACYLMNERAGVTVHDSSGRGHHGTGKGDATWAVGKYGRGVDLKGVNGYIEIPDHDDFTPALHPFSISAVVNMKEAGKFRIASKGLRDTNQEWAFGLSAAGKIYFYFWDEVESKGAGRYFDTGLAAYEDQWIHWAGTSDGGTEESGYKIYLNGVRIDDTDYGLGDFVTARNSAAPVYLGRYSGEYAEGIIDHCMFWRRVLTPSDVNRLYVNPFCMFERRGVYER